MKISCTKFSGILDLDFRPRLYTVYQENQYFVKNMLLLKNPQFLPNHYEILWICGTHEYLIFTKFRNDWVKIVDFLIKAYLWQSIDSPGTQCNVTGLKPQLRLEVEMLESCFCSKIRSIAKMPISRLRGKNTIAIWYFNKNELIWDFGGHTGLKQPQNLKLDFKSARVKSAS